MSSVHWGFLSFSLSFKVIREWGYNYYKNVFPADANIYKVPSANKAWAIFFLVIEFPPRPCV